MSTATIAPHRPATRASFLVFVALGVLVASWSARVPQVKARLGLGPAALGLVLLCIAFGSICALPTAGPLVHRFGSRRVVRAASVIGCLGMAVTGIGVALRAVALVVIGLLWLGLMTGIWDVGMNVQAARVEQTDGRSLMSRFHAGFSVGAVGGALLGAVMVALAVPVAVHLLVVSAAVAVLVPLLTRSYLPDPAHAGEPRPASPAGRSGTRQALGAWLERRTLLVGLIVAGFALAEGAGNDWLSVTMLAGHHASATVATLAYGVFLGAMTVGRWFGPGVIDRHGRVAVLRVSAGIAIGGLALYIALPTVPTAFLAVLLWGTGTALGFPLGISAGADEPEHAAARVGVVTSIGYAGLLAGPPLIGALGASVTVLKALSVVVGVLLATVLVAPAARRPPGSGALIS